MMTEKNADFHERIVSGDELPEKLRGLIDRMNEMLGKYGYTAFGLRVPVDTDTPDGEDQIGIGLVDDDNDPVVAGDSSVMIAMIGMFARGIDAGRVHARAEIASDILEMLGVVASAQVGNADGNGDDDAMKA